jgi:hypothetical protein
LAAAKAQGDAVSNLARKAGRPLEGDQAIVDDVLTRWGEEVGPDYLTYAKLGWPSETILSRIRREGAGAAQSGAPPMTMSDEAMVVDQAVRSLPKAKTRKVLRLWYCSRDRGNQHQCSIRACVSHRNFQLHLKIGREQVAELLGILA